MVRGSVRAMSVLVYVIMIQRRDVMCTIVGKWDLCIWDKLTVCALESRYCKVDEVEKVKRKDEFPVFVDGKFWKRLERCGKGGEKAI